MWLVPGEEFLVRYECVFVGGTVGRFEWRTGVFVGGTEGRFRCRIGVCVWVVPVEDLDVRRVGVYVSETGGRI